MHLTKIVFRSLSHKVGLLIELSRTHGKSIYFLYHSKRRILHLPHQTFVDVLWNVYTKPYRGHLKIRGVVWREHVMYIFYKAYNN